MCIRDRVAAYGTALHVIGRDGPALIRSAHEVAAKTASTLHETPPSLEDVFIQLMGETRDNAA